MRYSIEPKERRYVKGYVFLSFATNFGNKYGKKLMNTAIKTGTNFNSKYGKKLTDPAIKTGKDFATIAAKKIVHKSEEATGDLIGNKIADKITSASKKSQNEETQSDKVNNKIPKERNISTKERQKICVLFSIIIAAQNATFAITDIKLYVPVVTLSTQENTKFLQQLKSGFKRIINWNKYLSKPKLLVQNTNLNHLVEPSFQGVNRLFVLASENDDDRTSDGKYYLPTVEIKD